MPLYWQFMWKILHLKYLVIWTSKKKILVLTYLDNYWTFHFIQLVNCQHLARDVWLVQQDPCHFVYLQFFFLLKLSILHNYLVLDYLGTQAFINQKQKFKWSEIKGIMELTAGGHKGTGISALDAGMQT